MASIFLLSLTISVWLGLISPIHSQTAQQNEREALIQEIQEFAERHVKTDKAMDTSLVIKLYEQNAVGLTAPEIANIYEDEYTRLKEKKDSNLWKIINDNLLNGIGWGAAIILAILSFFRDTLVNWIKSISSKIGNWLYNRVSGLKFFWTFSLKRYRKSLYDKYRQLKIPFRPNRPLGMRDIFVPLKVSGKSDNNQIDAFGAVADYPRLMIKGSPGSGKSMLLKYLAFSWTEEKSNKISTKITPVLLELNRLNELEDFTLEQFQTKLAEAFKREDFPDANKALVDFLWHDNKALSYGAAWNLAELFNQDNFTETIQEFELTAEQKNADYLDWIWKPFNDSLDKSLSIIAGRIVYLLDKTPLNSIPKSLPKLDPRLIIPLLSIYNPVNIKNSNEWNSLADSLLEQQEKTPELEQKIIEHVDKILGDKFLDSPWKKILSSLKPKLQLDLLHRLINRRLPTDNDWRDLFQEITYEFKSSYHYILVLAVGMITSVIAISEIILLILRQPDNWNNVVWGLPIYILLVFWISLWQGIEERLESNTFLQLGLCGILTFGTKIQRLFNDNLVWAEISLVNKSAIVSSVAFYAAGCFAAVAEGFILASDSTALANVAGVVGVVGATGMFAMIGLSSVKDGIFFALVIIALFTAAIGLNSALAAAFIVFTALIGMGLGFWSKAESQTDWMRLLAIFAFPYFCWFPIVVVFSTLFMLRFIPWQYTALIWIIVFGTCATLYYGFMDKIDIAEQVIL